MGKHGSDLFGLPETTGLSEGFRPDPRQSGFLFDNGYEALAVVDLLWNSYRIAAGAIAQRVTEDAVLLEELLSASEGGDPDDRARSWIADFGGRAYRRPSESESSSDRVFDSAPGLYPGVDDFESGVRLVVEALLQSLFLVSN